MSTIRTIKYLSKWPLKRLRRHQTIINAQIEIAFKLENLEVLNRLQNWYDQVSAAISLREFGEY